MLTQKILKKQAADAALKFLERFIEHDIVIGIGTGSTVDCFIDNLSCFKENLTGIISTSNRSTARLIDRGFSIMNLNEVDSITVYIDGADEIDANLHMIKGGGGALTHEKIVASISKHFICIVDESKFVTRLGKFPLPIEVIPIACRAVSRAIENLGGKPTYRSGFTTDNGNIILDVANLNIESILPLESTINSIPGVVSCGLFPNRNTTVVAILATQNGIYYLE